jgi:hypothetical protein
MKLVVLAGAGAVVLAACILFAGCSKGPKEVPADTQAQLQKKMQEDMMKVRQQNSKLVQGQQQPKKQ